MSSGKNPLMLMMALAMPGASHALGLGDIHVDSALNERLAAEIDLVGTTAIELNDLRAAVANRETFLRYGADRPAFLSSATFKVAQDSHGRPVLSVRSTEPFTEPLVNFLVDLRWRNGELIREYTLLLDPPGFATPILERKIQTITRQVDPPTETPNARSERSARKTTVIKVGARATLRGIAWRVGERSPSDLQRMMIAIFRANPSAFDGNINRLHLGAVLTIPSDAQMGAISPQEAKSEFHMQMAAWHSRSPAASTVAARALTAPVVAAPVVADAAPELNKRVQSLEHELAEVQGLLVSQHDKIVDAQKQVALAEKAALVVATPIAAAPVAVVPVAAAPVAVVPVAVVPVAAAPVARVPAQSADAVPSPAKSGHSSLVPIAGGFGLLAAALAALYLRLRRRTPTLRSGADAEETVAVEEGTPALVKDQALDQALDQAVRAQSPAQAHSETRPALDVEVDVDFDFETQESPALMADDDTHPLIPVPASLTMPKRAPPGAATFSRPATDHTTLNTAIETMKLPVISESTRMDATRLDYNLVDLDMTAQHVHMPSVLNEQVVAKERRTNLADALKLALEREPDRHDLRMKLLELYYSAAATNRQGFLEVVQKFARDRDYLQPEEWDKIAFMGRQIASENPLFAERRADEDDLADCA